MEKIKINDIKTRGVVCIVKYDESLTLDDKGMPNNVPRFNCEATLNANFNAQEIFYLENDVGKEGTVIVEIKENKGKNGQTYTNITKVDFESAVKGEPTIQESMERMSVAVLKEVQNGERSLNGQEQNSLLKEANNEILKLKTLGSQEKFRTPKEMIATELVKAVLGIEHVALENDVAVENAYRMYKRVLELQG